MSVKAAQKHQNSKQPSGVYSLRHVDKSAQSASSPTTHKESLEEEILQMDKHLQFARSQFQRETYSMNRYSGFNDPFSKNCAKSAEEEVRLWQKTITQLMAKQKVVSDKLRELYGFQKKQQKKRNYVLMKIKEPPGDRE